MSEFFLVLQPAVSPPASLDHRVAQAPQLGLSSRLR